MDRAGLGKLHDTIPLVAGTAERGTLFPSPDLHQRVQRLDTGCIQEWNGTEWANLLCAAEGEGGAFIQAQYVVMQAHDDLTVERVATAGAGLSITDGGAGLAATFAVICPNYCGNGSPESVVTAAVGSWYLQRDAASTTHPLWAKRSGTGNTGWVAYAGHRGTGTQSLALGDSALASATNAQSFGQSANASAADTLAAGRSSIASAADGVAIGRAATASGTSAIAIGASTTASGTRSEAIGEGSTATGTDSKAFGVGATAAATTSLAVGALASVGASATSGIAIGAGATVAASAVKGVSIGDGNARNANDIIVGFSNDVGGTLAHPNVVIGKAATIGTTADASSPTPSAHGGHVIIGDTASAGVGPSAFPNVVIGRDASSVGRAVVAVGQGAQARAADTPVTGQVEGRFAVLVGYNSKGSGGCIVAVGDQSDVRGDNTAALGTHARANDNNTAAVGPNTFAGSTSSTGAGVYANAFGVSAQAKGARSSAIGATAVAQADDSVAIGPSTFISALLSAAVALGSGANPTGPNQLMIADDGGGGGLPILAVHFNGASAPAMLITVDGKLQLVDTMLETSTARAFPIAASITGTATDRNLFFSTTGGARVLSLPASGDVPIGTKYYVRKDTSGANTVTIDAAGSETIDGDPNFVLTAQWHWAIVQNDGSPGFEWTIVDTNT